MFLEILEATLLVGYSHSNSDKTPVVRTNRRSEMRWKLVAENHHTLYAPCAFTWAHIGHLPLFLLSDQPLAALRSADCHGNRCVLWQPAFFFVSPQCCHGVAQLMYNSAEQQGAEEVDQLTGGQIDTRDLKREKRRATTQTATQPGVISTCLSFLF